MKWMGWGCGLALAGAIAIIFPTIGFLAGLLLSVGLSGLGLVIGAAAER